MRRLLLFMGLLLLLLPTMQAQRWSVISTENTSNTLPSDKVYALQYDSDNVLWIATDKGLSKLQNGEWSHEETLSGKAVLNLFIDSKQTLWVATEEHGLYQRDKDGVWKQHNNQNGLADLLVQDVAEAVDGSIWVVCGASVCQLKDGNWTSHTPSNNPFTYFYTLAIDKDGSVWAGAESGLFQFKEGTWAELPNGAAFGSIQDILVDDSKMWFASQNGLQLFDGTNWRTLTTENGLPDNYITVVTKDNDGNLWIGTDGAGIAKRNGDQWQQYTTTDGLGSNDIYSICFSSDGRLTVGTHQGGFSYREADGWHVVTSSGLVANKINAVYPEAEGTWFATYAGISFRANSGAWTNYTKTSHQLPGMNARQMMVDSKGNRWFVFFDGGVAMLNTTTNKWTSFDSSSLQTAHATSIMEDANGLIWVTTFGKGIAQYNGSNWNFLAEAEGLPVSSLFQAVTSPSRQIWLASVNGAIKVLDNGKYQVYNMSNSDMPDNNVRRICFSSDGKEVYFCTNKGFVTLYEDGTMQVYDAGNGFVSDFVNHITIDKEGNKWISGWTSGFYLQTKGGRFVKIDEKYDFHPEETFSTTLTEQGELYLATNEGVWILKKPAELVQTITSNEGVTTAQSMSVRIDASAQKLYIDGANGGVSLFSIDGRKIAFAPQQSGATIVINTDNLPKGCYIVHSGTTANKVLIR